MFRFLANKNRPKHKWPKSTRSSPVTAVAAVCEPAAISQPLTGDQDCPYFLSTNKMEFDSHVYARAFQTCIREQFPAKAEALHCDSLKRGNCLDLFCLNVLLNAYVKLGSLSSALNLFDEMRVRNMVSFVTLMQGYVASGVFSEALKLFLTLHREGHELNQFVFTTVLKMFVNMDMPDSCENVHAVVVKLGHDWNGFVGAALIDAYSLCGSVEHAREVFDGIREKDIVVWTGMVSSYAENDCPEWAVWLCSLMRSEGLTPNNFTLTSLLKASVSLLSLDLGKNVHGCAVKMHYETDPYVGGALLDMYAKCGDIGDARAAFDMVLHHDVILWSFMIARYAQSDQGEEALGIFRRMIREFVVPNEFSFSSVLQACASMGRLDLGAQLHGHVLKIGFDSEIFVANALIDVYAKSGSIESSMELFLSLEEKNDVSWNTVIVGHVLLGLGEEALRLFHQMHAAQVPRSQVTYSSALRACASIAAIDLAHQVHSLIAKTPFNNDTVVGNSLIDTYAKCGSIKDARKIFETICGCDEISWNAMISGYAMHGLATEALQVFSKMNEAKVMPNGVTLVGVLSACSNMGLTDQGLTYFHAMQRDYGIEPCMEHYTCIVRLLGRGGQFDKAMKFIEEMPLKPSVMVWRAMLGACLIHKNVELGRISAEKVLELEPRDESAYVLLSNLYASAGGWDDVALVRKTMRLKCMKKEPGLSWLEVHGEVHSFSVGDTTHPILRVINGMLQLLYNKIKKIGYIPDGDVVLHDLGDDRKQALLWVHSERLALAYALIKMPSGTPIRIIKIFASVLTAMLLSS